MSGSRDDGRDALGGSAPSAMAGRSRCRGGRADRELARHRVEPRLGGRGGRALASVVAVASVRG
ncbi:hypothetical protein ACFPTY_11240 [Halomonas beimenensis]|uniref:hypothetical protein n=1 Tax=Halomonas beimenensis TaxID=475662 RepID=UPI0036124EFE